MFVVGCDVFLSTLRTFFFIWLVNDPIYSILSDRWLYVNLFHFLHPEQLATIKSRAKTLQEAIEAQEKDVEVSKQAVEATRAKLGSAKAAAKALPQKIKDLNAEQKDIQSQIEKEVRRQDNTQTHVGTKRH